MSAGPGTRGAELGAGSSERGAEWCNGRIIRKSKMVKGKKGQFYLIAAIILIAVVVALIMKLNSTEVNPVPLSFTELSDNFEKEAVRIIDNGISQGKSVQEVEAELQDFARQYSEYATSKSPQIGFLYVYGNSSNITVANFLVDRAGSVVIGGAATNTTGGSAILVNRLTFDVGGEQFVRDLSVRARAFKGINIASGKGDFVNLSVGGVPYYLTIKKPLEFSTLTIQCDEIEGECFVKLSE